MLSVGIVGCGRMGRERATACRMLGIEITVCVDIDESRAAIFANEFAVKTSLTDVDAIPWDTVSAVFLCTPPVSRGSIEGEVIDRGLPFLVEKPVGLCAAQYVPILHRLTASPVLNAVGYMNRYRPSLQQVKRNLSRARVLGLSGNWICKRYAVPWWAKVGDSGGPLNEQATHLIDICRFLNGEIAAVQAIPGGFDQTLGTWSSVAVNLFFRNGTLGTLLYSCDGMDKQIGMRVFTTEGQIVLDGYEFTVSQNPLDGPLSVLPYESVFLTETQCFVNAILQADPGFIQSDVADALRTQVTVDAVRKSCEHGNVIYIGDSELLQNGILQ
jgi:myo-inositol 2-dehydrogenase/D-chiro-inositol 1-dehydrogenase